MNQNPFPTFSRYFKIPDDNLFIAYSNPAYFKAEIPKKNGETRIVYAPSKTLKSVQRKIMARLSHQYLKHLPKPVMGFVKVNDWQKKRDIVANARKHLHQEYLINIDIKSFFGSIRHEHIRHGLQLIYSTPQFDLGILKRIVLLDGSLPPGAPTSPVLSNIVFIELDRMIHAYCKDHDIRYTRYADDMSFSSREKIATKQIEKIRKMLAEYGFQLNPDKTKFFGTKDEKVVTGVGIRNGKIVLAEETRLEILSNIKYYHEWKRQHRNSSDREDFYHRHKEIKRSIRGQLEFARRIEGNHGQNYQDLMRAYEQSLEEKEFITRLYI